MIKDIIFHLCISLLIIEVSPIELPGQNVKIEYENLDGKYHFYSLNQTPATYTITVNFKRLENLRVSSGRPYQFKAPPGRFKIFELRRENEERTTSFDYSYRTIRGCIDAKPRSVTYAMPVAKGKRTTVRQLSYLGAKYGGLSSPKDFYALSFSMQEGDTIHASRRGRVVEIKDDAEPVEKEGLLYKRGANYVVIQHDDCTYAEYKLFGKRKVLCRVGQLVNVGDPLGIVDASNFESGDHVRFSVYYYLEQDVLKAGVLTDEKHNNAYVKPIFATEGGAISLAINSAYTATYDDEIVMQEMSRRQKKKYLQSRP